MKKLLLISIILLVFPASAFADTITIGSKNFPESRLLTEIMAILIEENSDLTVERKHGLGGTLICFEALRAGSIDIYPEYTGTGLTAILKEELDGRNAEGVYARVNEVFSEKYDSVWLKPFGFNNTYALAIKKDIKAEKISDLEAMADSLKVGFSHEFINRPDGYLGLKGYYNFTFPNLTGMEHGLLYKAVEENRIDLLDAYSTDGKLLKYDLKLLEDDKNFFPPYFAAPVVRKSVLEKYPEVEELLNRLAGQISDQKIIDMNYRVEVKGEGFGQVAASFLAEKQLIPEASGTRAKRRPPVLRLTLEHIILTLTATGMAVLVGVPLGLLISRYRSFASPVIALSGVIQTIPSLAILGFMIPLFGIGIAPAIAALFLYALLPVIRNTYTGITSVPPDLKEAGKAMGMTSLQLLFMLELPLSTRIIMAGIRTAMVINIGTATLAAFIGAGGLGEPIVTGLTLNDNDLILWGSVPAAILALAVDFLLARFEKIIEPKGLKIK